MVRAQESGEQLRGARLSRDDCPEPGSRQARFDVASYYIQVGSTVVGDGGGCKVKV
jgi:hypothetical protein